MAIFLALGIAPSYREDWILENLIVVVAVPLLAIGHRSLPLSGLAYGCLFAFLVLHEIGAHYTYSEVPWRSWLGEAMGDESPFNGRNHYDRFVHFCYGLLVTPAARELIAARATPRGLWRWLLPLLFTISHSTLYEIVEWWAALLFGGDLGTAYLGAQGDPWDAQKDMALATLGAVVSTLILYLGRAAGSGTRTPPQRPTRRECRASPAGAAPATQTRAR